jgi:hypothetical protein
VFEKDISERWKFQVASAVNEMVLFKKQQLESTMICVFRLEEPLVTYGMGEEP